MPLALVGSQVGATVSSVKLRLVRALQRYLLNPPIKLLFRLGVVPPGYSLMETVGRRSGKTRQTPVGDGLIGETFWIVAEHRLRDCRRRTHRSLPCQAGSPRRADWRILGFSRRSQRDSNHPSPRARPAPGVRWVPPERTSRT